MEQRTTFDFSKHEVLISKFENSTIHHLKKPETYNLNVKFMNIGGILAVTGDLGNWIFCRPFVPSKESEKVSDGYWDEKLEIHSVQKAKIYDPEYTLNLIDEFEKYYSENESLTEEISNWISDLRERVDNEFEYIDVAYNELPNGIDFEEIPFGKERRYHLKGVYDAYDEIIDRYRKGIIKD